jgi:hypothetical protein
MKANSVVTIVANNIGFKHILSLSMKRSQTVLIFFFLMHGTLFRHSDCLNLYLFC